MRLEGSWRMIEWAVAGVLCATAQLVEEVDERLDGGCYLGLNEVLEGAWMEMSSSTHSLDREVGRHDYLTDCLLLDYFSSKVPARVILFNERPPMSQMVEPTT